MCSIRYLQIFAPRHRCLQREIFTRYLFDRCLTDRESRDLSPCTGFGFKLRMGGIRRRGRPAGENCLSGTNTDPQLDQHPRSRAPTRRPTPTERDADAASSFLLRPRPPPSPFGNLCKLHSLRTAMNDAAAAARPAWQTDELEDEWIDQETSDDTHPTASIHAHSTSDISFTQPLGSVIVRHNTLETDSPTAGQEAGGTFLIRDDVPAAPFLPKTPGRAKKAFGKDFFSPLALERMFEPPSPPANKPAPLPAVPNTAPAVPSRLSQVQVPSGEETEILEDFSGGDLGDQGEECGLGVEGGVLDCQFTFEAPRPSPFNPNGVVPTAQSTPGHPRMHSAMLNPPSTDPRLRLFQFQYDTFTRDHLSAMVDSIAVNTPSAGSGAATTTGHTPSSGLSPVREVSSIRMRSAKRIKLSPGSGMSSRSGDGIALIHRPKRKDYVGESKSLMDKIRRARDFSTVSTVASARSPGLQDRDSSPEEPEDNSVSRGCNSFKQS